MSIEEKCMWHELLLKGNSCYRRNYYSYRGELKAIKCDECNGRNDNCGAYLSFEEVERRRKEKELLDSIKSEK